MYACVCLAGHCLARHLVGSTECAVCHDIIEDNRMLVVTKALRNGKSAVYLASDFRTRVGHQALFFQVSGADKCVVLATSCCMRPSQPGACSDFAASSESGAVSDS